MVHKNTRPKIYFISSLHFIISFTTSPFGAGRQGVRKSAASYEEKKLVPIGWRPSASPTRLRFAAGLIHFATDPYSPGLKA